MENKDQKTAWFIGLGSFLIFFLYRWHYTDGDSLIYVDNILRGNFDDISVHFTYYALSWPLAQLFGLLGLDAVHAVTFYSVISGAVGVSIMFLIVKRLTGDFQVAVLTAVILAFSLPYLEYSIQAEVYAPQVAILLFSYYAFLRGWMVVSGACFSVAFFIAPLTLFFGVFYLWDAWYSRRSWRSLIVFAISSLAIVVPILAAVYHDFFWGRRGLLGSGLQIPLYPIVHCIKNFSMTMGKAFHVLLPFGLVGVVYGIIKRRRLTTLLGLFLVASYYIVRKSHDYTMIATHTLPMLPFIAFFVALGLVVTMRALFKSQGLRQAVITAVMVIFSIASLLMLLEPSGVANPRVSFSDEIGDTMKRLADMSDDTKPVLAHFRQGIAYAYYTRTDPEEPLEFTQGNIRWLNAEYIDTIPYFLMPTEIDTFFVIERYSPSFGARLLLSEEELASRFERFSLINALQGRRPGGSRELVLKHGEYEVYRLTFAPGGKAILEDRRRVIHSQQTTEQRRRSS